MDNLPDGVVSSISNPVREGSVLLVLLGKLLLDDQGLERSLYNIRCAESRGFTILRFAFYEINILLNCDTHNPKIIKALRNLSSLKIFSFTSLWIHD